MAAYSQDLRDRVFRALARNEGPTEIARRFEVSVRWVYEVKERYAVSGVRCSRPVGGYRRSCVADKELQIRAWIKVEADVTRAAMCERLAEHGWPWKFPRDGINSISVIWALKKPLHASEQAREDVQVARRTWIDSQPTLDVTKRVFLDETGASTTMTRTRGRAPKGARCVARVPHGHWKTPTFIAGLRDNDLTAPMVLDGAMEGEAFLVYVRTFLCPTVHPGDSVIADNVRSHKVAGVKDAIEVAGATRRSLPPYSPDLNPIATLFSKLNTLLRKAAKRSIDTRWNEIGQLLQHFSPEDCAHYFQSSGYHV